MELPIDEENTRAFDQLELILRHHCLFLEEPQFDFSMWDIEDIVHHITLNFHLQRLQDQARASGNVGLPREGLN